MDILYIQFEYSSRYFILDLDLSDVQKILQCS